MRHRNNGLKKRCRCPRKYWSKCSHSWHLNFKPQRGPLAGTAFRLSLDRETGKPITSRSEAETQATNIRAAIVTGTFRTTPTPVSASSALTFRAFADDVWKKQRGAQLVSAPLDTYRLKMICAFVVPVRDGTTFGDLPLDQIRTGDIEALRDARKAKGLSAVSLNHDLRLLRKMLNWAIRKGYIERTPFKIGTEAAIPLEREIPRHKRFQTAEIEERLLDAASPHLRAVVTAMLDTACRPGEIMSLQWKDVSLTRRELTIRAEKEKTRRERIIPISSRLGAILDMRKLNSAGKEFGPEAYVFGDAIGGRIKSVRRAWGTAATKAGLEDFQLRDLRHEAGSRFDEAGVSVVYVSNLLGHSNLSTTSRYLNINRRGLHLAMEKLEGSQRNAEETRRKKADERAESESIAHSLHTDEDQPQAVVRNSRHTDPAKLLVSN